MKLRAPFALVLVMLLGAASVATADDPGFAGQSAQQCLDCHENSGVLGILETKHADFEDPDSPAAQKQCQSCHGISDRHAQYPMQVENLHFGKGSKVAPRVQNEQCLECHESGARENWKASAHGFEDVLCNNCHSIHQPDRIIPTEPMLATTCNGSCHQDLMGDEEAVDEAAFTHPVGMELEGGDRMNCATCHNPHGTLSSTRCLECHEQTPEVLAQESEKAQRFHRTAAEKGTECIRCHKGLAHPISDLESEAAVHEPVGPTG